MSCSRGLKRWARGAWGARAARWPALAIPGWFPGVRGPGARVPAVTPCPARRDPAPRGGQGYEIRKFPDFRHTLPQP